MNRMKRFRMCYAIPYENYVVRTENVENLGRRGEFITVAIFSAAQNNSPNRHDGVAILGQGVSFQWRSIVSDSIK